MIRSLMPGYFSMASASCWQIFDGVRQLLADFVFAAAEDPGSLDHAHDVGAEIHAEFFFHFGNHVKPPSGCQAGAMC